MFKLAIAPYKTIIAVFCLNLILLVPSFAYTQEKATNEEQRQRAIQLVNEGKFVEALPLLNKLAWDNPSDGQVIYGLGIATYMTVDRAKDREARREARLRARTTLLKAKELGVKDGMLDVLINSIPPDGSERGVSNNEEANKAMHEAGDAFQRKDYNKAAESYERAFNLDPKLYEAALYAGNSYYAKKEWTKAGEWFVRAIAIDPNRETAYRYWGDALLNDGKQAEAREKFIDAIIAEPYNQMTWRGLAHWAQTSGTKIGHPQIKSPNSTRTEGDKTTLTLDPKTLDSKDGMNHWLMYDMTRTAWKMGEFAKQFPEEKTYRHSLREEATALRMVAEFAAKDLKEGKIKTLEPSLATLVKLNNEGLLEAYILISRADQGIAQDYSAFRQTNREKLRRYLSQYVVSVSK